METDQHCIGDNDEMSWMDYCAELEEDIRKLKLERDKWHANYENERERRRNADVLTDVTSAAHGAMTNAGVPFFDVPGSPAWSLLDRVKWLIARMTPADDRYE